MTPLPPNEEEIFHSALELAAGDRSAFLDRACAGDEKLRAAVESLLRLHTKAHSFLSEPAPDASATVALIRSQAEEKPGEWIDRYKLLQKIGEGGCGIVYMAEQEEPVRRRVALKVIKLGMDTKSVIARFEAERQALAMMDHPNIAKVLDAGATETGRPFFVMELVRGMPITKYCDEQNLGTAARLALFNRVCLAIQHAHQKGIIHRDIKPSNVLVTVNDGDAVPKVIDFGIAKATQGRLTDATLFTAFEQFIGTPAYMSPEQVEMTSLDIDTRSDIYALGVLLYELLTGRPPFDPKTLLSAGLDEMRRIIREVEPPKPSTCLSTLVDADRATIAKLRSVVPTQLNRQLNGDLDWIVMKALDKNRTRRYESASAFAADIERHLANEPVVARPPSAAYLLGKLFRRHRFMSAAAAAFLAAWIVGTAISAYMATRAVRAERSAAENDEAAKNLHRFLASGIFGQLRKGEGEAGTRSDLTLRAALDRAVSQIDERFRKDRKIRGDIEHFAGWVYFDLGEYPRAIVHLEAAVQLRGETRGETHPSRLQSMLTLAWARERTGEFAAARKLREEHLRLHRQALGPDHDDALLLQTHLGFAHIATGETAQGVALIEGALKAARKKYGEDDRRVILAIDALATALTRSGRPGEAIALFEPALARARIHSAFGPASYVTRRLMEGLARAYAAAARKAEAGKLGSEIVRFHERASDRAKADVWKKWLVELETNPAVR
jgi:eukaryotic-like serine/threonine-protein kinase